MIYFKMSNKQKAYGMRWQAKVKSKESSPKKQTNPISPGKQRKDPKKKTQVEIHW